MTNKEYRQHEGVSRSELNILQKQTPLHFKYAIEHAGEEDSKALHFGRISHTAQLEPERLLIDYAIIPTCDRRTKEGKEIYSKYLNECEVEGKEPITQEEYDVALEMKAAIDSNPLAKALLTGECEKSFFWVDEMTGEPCKVRPDCISEYEGKKYIVDYKTTDSCVDGAFEHSVKKYGYKLQTGMYVEGVFQNTFEDYGFAFVAQEKKPPYASRVYFCSEEFIREGYEQFRKVIGIYHFCKTNDVWAGYEGIEGIGTTLEAEGDI